MSDAGGHLKRLHGQARDTVSPRGAPGRHLPHPCQVTTAKLNNLLRQQVAHLRTLLTIKCRKCSVICDCITGTEVEQVDNGLIDLRAPGEFN